VKVVCGLGNPGAEYHATRHNVGWWVLDRAREEWRFPPFSRKSVAQFSDGPVGDRLVVLVQPLTYVNRSGAAVAPLRELANFDPGQDLLVVVDDVALDVGRVRFRAAGSSGGHNGLKSIEAALGTRDYARLRIGVGSPPADMDMAGWVLSGFEPEDEERICALLPDVVSGVHTWIEDGTEAAARRFNR
jgi:PTH1 family peptidyl-tRNA hydrolase